MAAKCGKDDLNVSNKITELHSFTIEWLLESLRNNDETFKQFHGGKCVTEVTSELVSEGKGFLSHVYRCKIIFDDTQDVGSYSTVIKIPFLNESDMNEEREDNMPSLTEVHKWECVFYNNFAKILRIPLPKVYKTVEWIIGKEEGCIHMEDLTLKGKSISFFNTINLSQVKCFIRHLARWHKNILCAQNWRGKYLKNATMRGNFIKGDDESVDGFLKHCKRKELIELVKKYRKFSVNQDFIHYINVEAHKDLNLASVIVHGDITSNNILWAIDSEGEIQNEIAGIIDWQVMHEGSPMSDLTSFLSLCCDGVVRRQAEKFAIQFYFDCLVKEFGSSGFIFQALNEPNEALKESFYNFGILKSLHAWEDVDRLLQEKYKYIFEKYQNL
uniref:CHK kinase-like domain-containing protein n=1 Tax=Panagrolaimus sp. ES5 TaxID=591445 RepID=A0AC34FLF5_9BILA